MKSLKHIENLVGDLEDKTSADMDERVLKDSLRALEKSGKTPAAARGNIWRTTTKIGATAAAAVVIVGILIGINLFTGSDRPTGNKITTENERGLDKTFAERGAHDNQGLNVKSVVQGTRGNLEKELGNVEQMFKAGNIDGLVAMLEEGEYKSKVAAANYLAKMGAAQALEQLEKTRNEYGTYDRGKPFARAVKTIASRVFAELEESGTAIEEPKVAKTAAEGMTGAVAMHTEDTAERIIKGRGDLSEFHTAGLLGMGEPREAKEVADGYPIKGGGSSIAEVAPTSALENLVLYYSFHAGEDPNIAVDISGNNLHGQVHGARYAKDEILGGVMSFNGDVDYISIPDIYLEGFTFSAWVKTPEPDSMNNRRIFTLYEEEHCYAIEGNTEGGISVGAEKKGAKEIKTTDVSGETALGESGETKDRGAESTGEPSSESRWSQSNWAEDSQFSDYNWRLKSNTWTHITVTYDGITGRIYRNGKLKEEGDIPAEGFTGTAYIGGIDKHNGGFWHGMIDEISLFNRALSEEEVGQLYLMTGEMVITGPTLTEGASGNGYYFDGEGDYIKVNAISDLGVEQTKMLWIYMDAYPLPHDVYLIDEGSNNNWIELIDTDGNDVPEIRAGFSSSNYFDSDGEIEVGHWYHIAVVSKASGDIATYINGVLDSSASGFSATNEPEAIIIGANSGPYMVSFKGVIDEVAIFNRALSDYEIQQVYQNTGRLYGNEAGLVGYWNFDADEGDIVKDGSPYHNDGILGDI
jgi:hypothetical protein